MLYAVRTGQPAFDRVHGVGFFEYFRRHPDEWAIFDEVMAAQTAPATRAVAAAYDFGPYQTIVDVGGGRGALALGLLDVYPRLRAIIFDQPAVTVAAQQAIEAAGHAGRCEAVGGDFFLAVPAGGDVYLLKLILHDWDDERCRAILRRCREAVPAHGRLLVIEVLVAKGNERSYAKSQDVNMLVNLGGRERSEDEYRDLYLDAGFILNRIIPIQDELHVLEGIPV
jgi:precorrin-6B methylase 2